MTAASATRLQLSVRAPFRLDLTVWVLRRQPHNAIDRWDGTAWRRALVLSGGALEIAVRQQGAAAAPRLSVACSRRIGALAEARLARLPVTAVREVLMAERGIGRWSAEYVLLRGLGRWDVFPAGDVGARKHLGLWLATQRGLDDAAAADALRRYAPYAGLVYFHLLLRRLAATGVLGAK